MDDVRPKQADWAPGTLEKTRKAIGNIDAAEAMKMSKVLGGEVMYERTQDFSGNSKKEPEKLSVLRVPAVQARAQVPAVHRVLPALIHQELLQRAESIRKSFR